MTIATPALIIGIYLLCGVIFASSRYLRGDKQADPFKYALKWPVYIVTNTSVSNVVELETEKDLAELRTILFDKQELKIRGYTWDGYDEAHKHLSHVDLIAAKNTINHPINLGSWSTYHNKPRNVLQEYRDWLDGNCLNQGSRSSACGCIYCDEYAKTYGWVEDVEAAYVLAFVEDKERTQRFVEELKIYEQKCDFDYKMSKVSKSIVNSSQQFPINYSNLEHHRFNCLECGILLVACYHENELLRINPIRCECYKCHTALVFIHDYQDGIKKVMFARDYENSAAKKLIDNRHYYRAI